jgi:serine/threonine-protein kinase RsbW
LVVTPQRRKPATPDNRNILLSAIASPKLNTGKPSLWDFDVELNSTPQEVRAVLERLEKDMRLGQLDPAAIADVQVVFGEVMNNIVEHAYNEGPDGWINIQLQCDEQGSFSCCVLDRGQEMPYQQLPPGTLPDSSGPMETLPEGGFGWFLIRQLTRQLTYQRDGDMNRLTFCLVTNGVPQ